MLQAQGSPEDLAGLTQALQVPSKSEAASHQYSAMKGSSRASSNRKAESRNFAQQHRASQGELATSPIDQGSDEL